MLQPANGSGHQLSEYCDATNGHDAVDELVFVRLGGVLQAVHICGHDFRFPLLLFLHGGPGMPHMPFAHANADLQRRFLVVHWDQRGAGKSYSPALSRHNLSSEQLVSDTLELVFWLCARFEKRTVVLVGHSWGSILAAIVAARYPDLVSAFVGIGQVSNLRISESVRFVQAAKMARHFRDDVAAATLIRLGPPPYSCTTRSDVLERWAQALSARYYTPVTEATFARLALSSAVYSQSDLAQIPLGRRFSEECLWDEVFNRIDLFTEVPRLAVPAFFLVGRHDQVVTHETAYHYFDHLNASRGKQFVTFERSGHWPHLEQSERFRAVLTGTVHECVVTRSGMRRRATPRTGFDTAQTRRLAA